MRARVLLGHARGVDARCKVTRTSLAAPRQDGSASEMNFVMRKMSVPPLIRMES